MKNVKCIFFLFFAGSLIYCVMQYARAPEIPMKPVSQQKLQPKSQLMSKPKQTLMYWESLTIGDPDLRNWTSCAYGPGSVMLIKNKKKSYQIGDVILVDMILEDFLGRRKTKGGDIVRLWARERESNSCAAGFVTDNHDGSYQGRLKLLWAGTATITATISTPRELVGVLYREVRSGHRYLQMTGMFRRGNITEIRPCSPNQEYCNMTSMNSNLPWYCKKPVHLSCDDYYKHGHVRHNVSRTVQEELMIKSVLQNLKMNTTDLKVHADVRRPIRYNHSSQIQTNLEPCNTIPLEPTWNTASPVGYLHKGIWYSTHCRSTFDGSLSSFRSCLKGKKVWLFGDSTVRQLFEYFAKYLNTTLLTQPWVGKWHYPSVGVNKETKFTMSWAIHALPVLSSDYEYVKHFQGTHKYIDLIPANSTGIVLVHFYQHFILYHPDVLRHHVRQTAESIRMLKKRAPSINVFVKGSHGYKNSDPHFIFYDFWGVVYDEILKEEFSSLTSEVVFLDMMDITVAAENEDVHPWSRILIPVINHMMSFVCS